MGIYKNTCFDLILRSVVLTLGNPLPTARSTANIDGTDSLNGKAACLCGSFYDRP